MVFLLKLSEKIIKICIVCREEMFTRQDSSDLSDTTSMTNEEQEVNDQEGNNQELNDQELMTV